MVAFLISSSLPPTALSAPTAISAAAFPSASLRHSMPPRKKQRGASGAAAASNAAAADSSSSAGGAAATLLTRRYSLRLNPPQPHQKLHRHALESIFAALSFDELCSVMFVSRDWLSAVYSMRGLVKGRTLRSQEQITAALPSRLARHVTSIEGDYGFPTLQLNRAQVQQIASRMPFLRRLSFGLHGIAGEEWSSEERLAGATLTDISIRFNGSTSAASIDSVIAAFSHHEPLTDLMLRLDGPLPEQVSFAPLQSLPALQTLRITQDWTSEEVTFTPEQVQEVRSLTQIEVLHYRCREQTLLQLLQPPHQLRWTALPSYSAISGDVAALLPSLKHLRTLKLDVCPPSLSSLDFLAQLPSLTAVDIEDPDADALLQSLSVTLPQVRKLRLEWNH